MRHLTQRRRVQLAQSMEDYMSDQDKPLEQDIAEVEREGQMLVDRNIRAREELAASNQALDEYEAKVGEGAARALNYIRQYRNPTQTNPAAPLAPDVAAPPPAEEPPVFTTIDTLDADTSNTSGGFVESVPGELNTVFEAGDEAVAAGDTNADNGGSGSGDPAA